MKTNKRAEVTPRTFIYGFIIFTLLITGGVYIISQFALYDGSFTTSKDFQDFNQTFNKLEELNRSTSSLRSNIENTQDDNFGLFGVLNGLVQAAWNTIQSIFTSFDFTITAIGGFEKIFGVPTWIITLLTSMIIVMFAFSIYSLIFQRST